MGRGAHTSAGKRNGVGAVEKGDQRPAGLRKRGKSAVSNGGLQVEASQDGRSRARSRGKPRQTVREQVIALLRDSPAGLTKAELKARIGDTSGPTLQRVFEAFQEDGAMHYDRAAKRWRLDDPEFRIPLEAPESEDVTAIMLAAAILEPLGDAELNRRLARIHEQLDEKVGTSARKQAPKQRLSARLSMATQTPPDILRRLLRALRQEPIRIIYKSPWKGIREPREIEPLGLRWFDGSAYLRVWDRGIRALRTLRLAHIESVDVIVNGTPLAPSLSPAELWSDGDPALGIDNDRPDVATIRVRGAVARWVHEIQWHPKQTDRWLAEGQLLERTVAYRSCREMARRLLSILDAIEHIEPKALRDEVDAAIDSYIGNRRKGPKSVARNDASRISASSTHATASRSPVHAKHDANLPQPELQRARSPENLMADPILAAMDSPLQRRSGRRRGQIEQ